MSARAGARLPRGRVLALALAALAAAALLVMATRAAGRDGPGHPPPERLGQSPDSEVGPAKGWGDGEAAAAAAAAEGILRGPPSRAPAAGLDPGKGVTAPVRRLAAELEGHGEV